MRTRAIVVMVVAAGLGWVGAPRPGSAGTSEPQSPNPFLGGVPTGTAAPGVLDLSLSDALARGLAHNLGALLSEQGTRAAYGARLGALSALLPTMAGGVTQAQQRINLEAYGFPVPPGTSPIIGPFDVFDARVSLSQTIFDYSAIERLRASNASEAASKYAYQDARDIVVLMCSNLYLQVITGAARVDAARAQLRTADVLYKRAVNLKAAGVVAGIEVLRAQVQLQSQQQRVIVLENDLAKQKLALGRAIGLPSGQQIELTDRVPYSAFEGMTLEDSLRQAYAARSDFRAAGAALEAAEAARRAAQGEGLPSVYFDAAYGEIGNTAGTAKMTYLVAATLRVPIFQGGRVRGRVLQADAALQQQKAQLEDLRGRIDYEVRAAFLDLKAADEFVHVAKSTTDLANEQLAQAQDRFTAGVASNIEVVQAQEAVATATESYLSSLYAHNLAKVSLARALGTAEKSAGRFLGGVK
jgi:outer membrane protein TolC